MSRFTDQEPHVVTAEDLTYHWGGGKPGERLRCYLCGHKFKPGDLYRWIHNPGGINCITCEGCDGGDVLDRWRAHIEDARQRFWWFTE